VSEWSEWFVYRIDGPPIGPLTTQAVAEAVLAGNLPPDCWVAAPGTTRWLRALDVPVIAKLLDGMPTRRRPSGIRVATLPLAAQPAESTRLPRKMDETVFLDGSAMGEDRRGADVHTSVEPSTPPEPSPPPTVRSVNPRGPDGFPIPPPSSSPTPPSGYRGTETLEDLSDDTPRKKTLGS
jgi:hypothetical protein